jgi:hypothetical protein
VTASARKRRFARSKIRSARLVASLVRRPILVRSAPWSCHTYRPILNLAARAGVRGAKSRKASAVVVPVGHVMRKVIVIIASGLMVAACSSSIIPQSPQKTALRFESVPAGAQVKVAGQTCRTPCELTLEVAELSATFARKGYQPQTVAVHSERSPALAPPRFASNPVHADLMPVGASARKRPTHEPSVAAAHPRGPVSADATASSNAPEATPQSNSAGWSPGDVQ